MDQKFTDYYTSLGMGSVLIEKISTIHDQFMHIVDDPPQDVVVSEYVTEDRQRQYMKACFFSDSFVYEVEDWMSESYKIWIANLAGNIGCFCLTPRDYDFHAANPASRLNLECYWKSGSNFMLDIKTSWDNCTHLVAIVNKYLKPNLT
ncbi:hypothetical protein KA005_01865 [bacterium]|nr:hypothetical protein [bacterium]